MGLLYNDDALRRLPFDDCLLTMPFEYALRRCLATMPFDDVLRRCLLTMPAFRHYLIRLDGMTASQSHRGLSRGNVYCNHWNNKPVGS